MLNLGTLNPEQREAVETVRGPVLILAGAGTGKTRVITHRIAHMIDRGVNPSNVLAVTFTNKAAREMQERVRQIIPKAKKNAEGKTDRPTICTFHSLCVRVLRKHIHHLGYKRNFVIYNDAEQLGTIKKILSNISLDGEKADAREVLSLISRYKNCDDKKSVVSDTNTAALAEHVIKHYESSLKACNAVDFDDLILLTLRLFEEHQEALEACREQYRYVMVDEYQDTNGAQFRLVKQLTSVHRNLCVVGDDDQSIYGWRGAEIANLLDLEKHFPEVKIVKLEQNYRSTTTILNAANAVIKNNARRRAKSLWSRKGEGALISLQPYEDDEKEADGIVEAIEYCRMGKRIPWKDQAILFRTNIQSRPIEMALRKAEIRYHLIGGQSFFDRREIKDFLAYLKTLINPDDDVSLLRIANVPARGLSNVTMERLLAASQERTCSVFAAMKNPLVQSTFQKRTQNAIEEFIGWVEETRAQLDDTYELKLADWTKEFLDDIGYWNELRRSEKSEEIAENRIRNLRDLLLTLDREPEDDGDLVKVAPIPSERLLTFLEEITLDAERDTDDENVGDAVTLITMHSCKGLEYPHVYIVGLEDGLLPHSRSKVEGTLDEERRLFYVAITRAQETLTISHCASRKKYGQMMPCHPSGFLSELPEDLVENAEDKGKEPVSVESGKSKFDALREALG